MPSPTHPSRVRPPFDLADASAAALLRAVMDAVPADQVVFTTSLGAEDQALLALLVRAAPAQARWSPRVVFLDTGRHVEATQRLLERTRTRFGVPIEVQMPDAASVGAFVADEGPEAFRRSLPLHERCCYLRKVEPLRHALSGARVWLTGLRRAQSPERADTPRVAWDEGLGLWKVNPLVDWNDARLARFARERDLPLDELPAQGYPSIGYEPSPTGAPPRASTRRCS